MVAPGRTEVSEGMQVRQGWTQEKGEGERMKAGKEEECRARGRKKAEEEGN